MSDLEVERRGLRALTPARVALERSGEALATAETLALRMAEARARDAVWAGFDAEGFAAKVRTELGVAAVGLRTRAVDRAMYLRYPESGRRLGEESARRVERGEAELAVVLGDGLSAGAAERYGMDLLRALLARVADWRVGPVCCVEGCRVAVGDEIGERMGASAVLVVLGERPGMSVPSSLGAYLTWGPRVGLTDAHRTCLSNVHEDGVRTGQAADFLWRLLETARRDGRTGVGLRAGGGKDTERMGAGGREQTGP